MIRSPVRWTCVLVAVALCTPASAGPAASGKAKRLCGRAGSSAARCKTKSSAPDLETVAWQVALDRALFSPGVIDGKAGQKTTTALRQFQATHGLATTGRRDAETAAALGVGATAATRPYTITEDDLASVGPWPQTWLEKSQVARLGYKSLASLAAERGHCTQGLLGSLNPGISLEQLRPGDTLTIPAVDDPPRFPTAARLEVNLAAKTIRPLDGRGNAVALFHCSIAKHKEKRPSGSCRVRVVSPNPVYVFDPRMWPEVRDVHRKLVIPAGPRNPVGLFWIGLSLPGYGIHGTPEPEMIGKTGSHGCFRLTNWDAVRLGQMVRRNIPVEFLAEGDEADNPIESALAPERMTPGIRGGKRPGTALIAIPAESAGR